MLVVCTGNICRSPLIEQRLRAEAERLDLGDQLVFESAGVFAEAGKDAHRETKASMLRFGFEPQPHVARQLTPEMLERADLVLTSTAEHRAQVARQLVKANRYTFTHKEFVRIAEFLRSDLSHLDEADQVAISSANTVGEFVDLVSKYRGYAPRPESPEDVVDPWGHGSTTYDAVTQELSGIATRTIELLAAK